MLMHRREYVRLDDREQGTAVDLQDPEGGSLDGRPTAAKRFSPARVKLVPLMAYELCIQVSGFVLSNLPPLQEKASCDLHVFRFFVGR